MQKDIMQTNLIRKNIMQKNNCIKKIFVLLLTVIMLTQMLPIPAAAAIDATKNNSPEQNQEILDILRSIFVDDYEAQAILETMNSLGLLDENGEFISAGVEVDGRILTLDEVRELVNSEDADLNRIVSVDGTELTLGNFKIMIEIEDELRRIKDTYFRDDVSLNMAQIDALSSIRRQIETEGIRLFSSGASGSFGLLGSSGESTFLKNVEVSSRIDHTIRALIDTSTLNCDNAYSGQSVAITLVDSSGSQLTKVPHDISLDYRFVDGSAKKGTNYSDTSGFNGTVTFTKDSTQTQKSLTFNINNDGSRFSGRKAFVIQFYDPSNIVLFDRKNGTDKDNMLSAEKVIIINKAYEWPAIDVTYQDNSPTGQIIFTSNDKGTYNTIAKQYNVPDEMLNIMIDEGVFNTVDFSVIPGFADYDRIMDLTAYVTFGHDGGNLFHDPIYPNVFDSISFDIGTLYKGQTIKRTTDSSFVFRPEKMKDAFTVENGGNFYLSRPDIHNDSSVRFSIRFYDTKAPKVKSVSASGGEIYQYGQSVPIVVEFSEPVNMTNVTMNVNGRTLAPVESSSTGTRQATFLYTVNQLEEYDDLNIASITGAADLIGNKQEPYDGTTLYDVMAGLSKFYSFSTDVSGSSSTDDGKTTVTAFIPISDNSLTMWMSGSEIEYDPVVGANMVQSIYASIDGGVTRIPLYYTEDVDGSLINLRCSFVAKMNDTVDDVTRAVEFYYTDDDHSNPDAQYKNMAGKYAAYTVPPIVFLEERDLSISDSFPADGIVFLQEGVSFNLKYTVSKAATWGDTDDFVWSSSDTSVATIDNGGVISFTGQPTGEIPVTFTLTAKNGGVSGKEVSITSDPLTVKVGLIPFLSIPEGTNRISVRSGEDAEVRWTSNLIAKNAESGQNAVFTVETFAAVDDGSKGASVNIQTVTGSTTNPIASCVIPASVLNGISKTGSYSYIVEVSAINPFKATETLGATAYISIGSQPAYIRLNKLNSYFITDAKNSIDISWAIKNFDTINDPKFEFEITDNSDGRNVYTKKDTQDEGGSYRFAIDDVEDGVLKDVYTVTVKAKNALDSTWSYDSFVLYVYSDEAMRIWIDGMTANQNLNMSNIEKISGMTSEQILALNREIYLKHIISINYGDHTWGQISDQIKWKSSDPSVASINFKEISSYSNIEDINYISYRPTNTFLMSGLDDGDTRITATHSATNKTETIDVRVETLKDKLYLFQINPKAKTALSYINGNGKKCTVDTNDNGELALYEESGIKSEIHMKSSHASKEYIGTLYNTVSSEKNYTKLELYPVNYFKLREISTAELYFKKPDGSAFSGNVILRGGVYKNGEYCADAKLNGKAGTADQTIPIDSDGRFIVDMDPTQFWVKSSDEVLDASDDLDFIFEVRFPEDKYYPRLLNIDCKINISRNFRFVNNAASIDDLSILWTETQNAHITDKDLLKADKDLLKAVKFKEEDRYVYITSPLEVAEMDDYTLIDHFSVYNSGIDTVKAVLLGTNYGSGYEDKIIQVEENGVTKTKTISVPIAVSNLYTATGTYENNIGINYVAVDYTSVIRGMTIPVQFSVYNAGVEPIESITMKIGDNTAGYGEDFLLLPNESKMLTVYYDVAEDKLVNPAYIVTAQFESGVTDTETDLLYLDIPDVGMSKLDTLSDDNGKRVMQVTLYNNSDSVLAGSRRDVKIGFYSDEDCTVAVTEVSGQELGGVFTVEAADLALVDAGAYTHQFTFDIGAHVGAEQEIPDVGVRLYAKVWIEEPLDPDDMGSGTDTIVEYNTVNNIKSILFESLLKAHGDSVSISTEQTYEGGSTEAIVTLKNNSLANTATGNLIVSLQDNSGNILESMQCYDPNEVNNGLISLNGEGTARRAYSFSRAGISLAVSYSNAVLDKDDNAELTSLSLTGIPLKLESRKTEYVAEVKNLSDTFISATTSDPKASVTVNGKLADMGNILINLRYGINKINIEVTAADGTTVKKYTVSVTNTRTGSNDNHSSSSRPNTNAATDSGIIHDITNEEITRLINDAGNNGNIIIVNPTFTGEEGRIEFSLTGTGMSSIAASGATLRLNTPILNLILSPAAIADLAGRGNREISIIIEIVDGIISVSILADGKKLDDINGDITALLSMPDADNGTVAAYISADGAMDIIRLSALKNGFFTVPLSGSSVFTVMSNALEFSDTENHWAERYIDFVTARNLFQGTGANHFDPEMSMTRGMIVTVLGRLSGIIPDDYDAAGFSDIDENAYYARYVEWAARNGIVQGVGNNLFDPDEEVTREQLAVILYNYSQYMGLTLAQVTDGTELFADEDEISGYARDAVAAMQRAGIINGKGGNQFDPKGKACRAEVSALLERFVSSIIW